MFRLSPTRGVSAAAITLALLCAKAQAQQSLPAIDIGAGRQAGPARAPRGAPAAAPPRAAAPPAPISNPPVVGLQPPNSKLQLDIPSSTGSRLGLTPRQTPGSVTILDRATIEARGARSTQEIIQRLPGVVASDPPGSPGSITLRGFGATSVTQMFNGITVQYDSVAARPMDSWLTERVELLGGASSYLYGQGAVGGAINYVSKIAKREEERNEALLMGGMFFDRQAAVGFNRKINDSNWVQLDASYSGSDGWMQNTPRNSGVVSASWLTEISPRLSNTVAVEFQSERANAYFGTPAPRPAGGANTLPWNTVGLPVLDLAFDPATRFKNYNARAPVFGNDVLWVRDIAEYALDGETKVKNTFYFYRADRQWRNVESYAYNATNTLLTRSSSLAVRHVQSFVGDRLEATNETKIFGLDARTVGGVDYFLNQQTRGISTDGNGGTVDVVHPYTYVPVRSYDDNPFATGFVGSARGRISTLALFFENRLSLTPQLHVVTGARWETISFERFNFRLPSAPTSANPFGDPAYFAKGYQPFTWRAALMYDVTKEANVYVSYSTAADPAAGTLLTNNAGSVRNFDLTTGWQLEAGSKADFWDGRGAATLAGYFIERKNLSVPDPVNPQSVQNIGKQLSNGIEFSAGVQVTPTLSVQANAAWINAKLAKFEENITVGAATIPVSLAGSRPTNSPRWLANGWIAWDFMPDWQWTFATRFVGDRFADNRNRQRVPAFTTFDTGLTWKVTRNAKLTALVKNIADATPIEWANATPLLRLGQPRTFELSLKVDF